MSATTPRARSCRHSAARPGSPRPRTSAGAPDAHVLRTIRLGLAQEPECALLLEVQGPRGRRLDPADPSPQLGDLGPDPRIGEDADAEGERDGADVVAPLQR